MTGFFTQIEDTEEVRRGDIIRKLNPKTGEAEKLGIVITADCDIAQRKAGERYTWLEIMPMAAQAQQARMAQIGMAEARMPLGTALRQLKRALVSIQTQVQTL